jgi:hypothetical protein
MPRFLSSFLAPAICVLACSGSNSSQSSVINQGGTGSTGGATSSGGVKNTSGATSMATASGGASSGGGLASSGGSGGVAPGGCRFDSDCPALGCYLCPASYCVNGECVSGASPSYGGASSGSGGTAGSAGHGGSAGSAGQGGTAGSGLDPEGYPIVNPPGCPAAEPAANAPCPQQQLGCSYGDDLHCRSHWGCNQLCNPVCSQDLVWELGRSKRDCPGLCPAAEPHEGDSCGSSEIVCTYGDQAACRTEWDCLNGHWTALVGTRDCQSAVCPDAPVVNGSCNVDQITPMGGDCVYKYGLACRCNCMVDHGDPAGGPPPPPFEIRWGCSYPIPGQAPSTCPLQIPTSGTPCQQSQACPYSREGACTNTATINATATCVSGQWQVVQH